MEQALQKLLSASTWEEIKAVLEAFPELLSDKTFSELESKIETYTKEGNLDAIEALNHCYLLLDEFRLQFEKWDDEEEIPAVFEISLEEAQAAEARYDETGDLKILGTAITAWESIVNHKDFSNACLEFRTGILNNSANSYLRRYWAENSLTDLEFAQSRYETVVQQSPMESPDFPMYLNNLGIVLNNHYALTGKIENLHRAIDVWQQAVDKTPSTSTELAKYLSNLGNSYNQLYAQTGNLNDLQRAIDVQEKALQYELSDVLERPLYLTNLGNTLLNHYGLTGEIDILQRAIGLFQDAVHNTTKDSTDLAGYLNNLANGLTDRYLYSTDLEDLQCAINFYQQAVAKTPLDNDDTAIYLKNLATVLHYRYIHSGEIEDLQQAIEKLEKTIDITPDNSPDLPLYLNSFASALNSLYAHTGNEKDLQSAIDAWTKSVQKSNPQSPDYAMYLNGLGAGFNSLYELDGEFSSLEKSINAYQNAVDATQLTAIDLPVYLNNLASGLAIRYAVTGEFEDLQKAIDVFQQAVQETPEKASALPMYLNNLGNSFRERYLSTGLFDDLEQAIDTYFQAVETAPENATDLPLYLGNLANGLSDRYTIAGNPEDLQQAISISEEAVQKTSANSPGLASRLNSFSVILLDRYDELHEFADLQRAMALAKQALDIVDINAPVQTVLLHNFATCLVALYIQTGQLEILNEAIETYNQSIEKTHKNSPDLAMYLNNLATALQDRFDCTQNADDFQQAINLYKQAAQLGLEGSQQEALRSARNWLNWAFSRQSWQEVEQAYEYAHQASEQLFKIQLLRYDKEIWLRETQDLATQAAYAFAKNNQLQQAVMALEKGLARLHSEALARDRADLEQLKMKGNTELYANYQQLIDKWHFLLQQVDIDEKALRLIRNKLDACIEAIQQIQGFEQFLKPPDFATIQQATQETTLVYIFATQAGGLALLVEKEMTAIWLPLLNDSELHDRLNNNEKTGYLDNYYKRKTNQQAWLENLDNMTAWLWQSIMSPVIEALSSQDKVTLIPVGLLGLLPLHAAWTETTDNLTNRRYALDTLTINYAPNARVLNEARQIANRVMPESLLIVNEPQPVHAESLPYSTVEVQAVISHFSRFKLFQYQQATSKAILKALPDHTVLHFSCHGLAQLDKPLSSGLLMACVDNEEQFITLADLLNLHLSGVRLASLSACETNISATTLPDEVINFSAGLLQAGVAGVVASLWSVENLSSFMLMTYFYECWQKQQLEPVDALHLAQLWIKDSTNQQKLDYVKARFPIEVYKNLRNEIGFSKMDENNFAHPYYWAAFSFVGK